ncbi:MAG: methylmalonyl Co-A mutase-associated GTPase MeaB [Proteobacteria bacterium]|nr:methylmalonyl Co-A mutase-associated GTPase MeaB [Pseudomonadota bacterium]
MQQADIANYIEGVKHGDRRLLSKAITLVESVHPDHQESARRLVDNLLPFSGKGIRLGVTGVPGVGKSTFIESLGLALIEKNHRVAVLAVDPSSRRSGGSILGDKTRMEKLSAESHAFIRPSPSGGTLGGVAAKTREAIILCEAAGFDVVIVETVGVGQSETVVSSMVDFFLILMLAGAGDELQGIKKGIMELADAIAINKADGENLEKAEKAKGDYENALHYLMPASPIWRPVVHTVSAIENKGVQDIWDAVLSHREAFLATGALEHKRKRQAIDWMNQMVEEELKRQFYSHPYVKTSLPDIIRDIENGLLSPGTAFKKLFALKL